VLDEGFGKRGERRGGEVGGGLWGVEDGSNGIVLFLTLFAFGARGRCCLRN